MADGTGYALATAKANADLIVSAVNSHAKLLAACEASLRYSRSAIRHINGGKDNAPMALVALGEQLEAAIAATEPTP